MERNPISERQLCAVVRSVIDVDASIDDAEWKARVKDRIAGLGYDYPRGGAAAIASALSRVERAVSRQRGPRPAPRQASWR
jgi:hypothetical protein